MGTSMSTAPAQSSVPSASHTAMPPSPPVQEPVASSAFRQSSVPPPPADSGSGKMESVPEPVPVENGPGSYEEIHKKCKDLFPAPFEGAKLIINKVLSNHFQISHSLNMGSMMPSGYKFGATYIGDKQFSPSEAYPVMLGEIDPNGNMTAQVIHQLTRAIRCRFVSQIHKQKMIVAQASTEYRGKHFVAALTAANPNIIDGSGFLVGNYLHSVSQNLSLGCQLLLQCGEKVPENHNAVFSAGARYTGDKWQLSGTLTPLNGEATVCYYQKVNDSLQIGVELESDMRTQECTAGIGYQLDLPKANLNFRGHINSNLIVQATLEKKLQPLPFTFALSAMANHTKAAYHFGIGLILG